MDFSSFFFSFFLGGGGEWGVGWGGGSQFSPPPPCYLKFVDIQKLSFGHIITYKMKRMHICGVKIILEQ